MYREDYAMIKGRRLKKKWKKKEKFGEKGELRKRKRNGRE